MDILVMVENSASLLKQHPSLKGSPIADVDIWRLLTIYELADSQSELSWRVLEPYTVSWYATCNDVFYWGCADSEKIDVPADLKALEQCFFDLYEIDKDHELSVLFAARKRKMRPMHRYIDQATVGFTPTESAKLRSLFEACGPPRDARDEG